MRLNKKKGIIICVIIIIVLLLLLTRNEEDVNKVIETETKIAKVTEQTILTTLTAPGEVKSANEEDLFLNTSYYFSTMCVESGDYIEKGERILKYTNGVYMTAPYNCVITSVNIPEVNTKCLSSNYISISSTEKLYMDINIGEDQINNIIKDQEVDIVVNNNEEKLYKGTITKINAIGTKSNGGTTYAAIASLDNDGSLKIGMSATCTITIEKNENLICVPIEAVYEEDSKRYVNKVNGDNIEKTEVLTGKADATYVEITEGLNLGEEVKYDVTTVTVLETVETKENPLTNLLGGNRKQKGGF